MISAQITKSARRTTSFASMGFRGGGNAPSAASEGTGSLFKQIFMNLSATQIRLWSLTGLH